MAKGRRGRPAKAQARRRATTRAGRAPPVDRGTPELRELRRRLVGRNDLTLDPLGALLHRELITRPAYDAGSLYGALSALSCRGWSLSDGSLTRHYRRCIANGFGLLADDTPGVWSGSPSGDGSVIDRLEAARIRLVAMDAALWRPGEGSLVFHTTRVIVLDRMWTDWVKRYLLGKAWPKDVIRLDTLREGLKRLGAAK